MKWFIVPQEVKEKGEVVGYEDCKHVKCFPDLDRRGNVVGFGRFKFPVLKVVLGNDHGTEHRITWSNYHGTPLSKPSPGKFTYHWPDKMEHPKYVVRGREYPDTLSPKVRVAGDKSEFESHAQFTAWLAKRVGQPLADEVMAAFAAKMVEVMAPPAKAA